MINCFLYAIYRNHAFKSNTFSYILNTFGSWRFWAINVKMYIFVKITRKIDVYRSYKHRSLSLEMQTEAVLVEKSYIRVNRMTKFVENWIPMAQLNLCVLVKMSGIKNEAPC